MKGPVPALVLVLLLAGCAAPAGPDAAPGDGSGPGAEASLAWSERAPAPRILAETAVAVDGSSVFIVGGWTEVGGGSPFVQVYDAEADAWAELPPYPIPVHHAQAAAVDGTLFVFGGALQSNVLLPGTFTGVGPRGWTIIDQAFRLPPGAGAWESIAPLPEARGLGGAAVIDGVVYLVGGVTLGGEYLADVVAYDPAADSYETVAQLPTLRDHLNVLAKDGELWAVAGRRLADAWDDLGAVEALDVASGAWRTLPEAPHGRGGQGAAFLADGRLALVGGENAEGEFAVYDEGHALDPATGAWEALPAMPQPLHGMAAAGWDGKLLVIGGATETQIQTSTLMLAPQEA